MKILIDKIEEKDKEIIVFYFPFMIVSGGPIFLTNLAVNLSKKNRYLVYYIEYKNGMGRNYLIGSKVKVIDYEDQYVFSLFPNNEVTIITPIYWGDRVPILNSNSKIVFFNWHNLCISSLKASIRCNNAIIKEFLHVVSQNTAEFYCDKAHWLAQEKYGIHFKELYVPVTISERGIIANGELVDCKSIRIAVLGRLVIDKIYAITDLIENIINTVKYDGKEVKIYIIGDGNCRSFLDKYFDLKHIEVILMGTLGIQEINKFLVESVDLLFAMGTSVLEGAIAAIPSVVIPNDICEFNCNRYAYIYECKDYLLGWAPEQIDEFGIKTHTVNEILEEVYNGGKCNIGNLCRKYCLENHIDNVENFVHAIDVSTLTYDKYHIAIEKTKRDTRNWIRKTIYRIITDNTSKNIVIWGAGKGGKKIAKVIKKMNYNVTYFVDKNADSIKSLEGVEVKNPNLLNVKNDLVIVSLMTYLVEIPELLEKKGFVKGENYIYVFFAEN